MVSGAEPSPGGGKGCLYFALNSAPNVMVSEAEPSPGGG